MPVWLALMAVLWSPSLESHNRTVSPRQRCGTSSVRSRRLQRNTFPRVRVDISHNVCQIIGNTDSVPGGYSIRLHIWEKGNAGLMDLSHKLTSCFKHALCDYLLELCLLPLPIARLGETAEDPPDFTPGPDSPFILIDTPSEGSPIKVPPQSSTSQKASTDIRSGQQTPTRQASLDKTPVDSPMKPDDPPRRSRRDTHHIMEEIQDALQSVDAQEKPKDSELEAAEQVTLTWHHKEKLRRWQEARETELRDAHFGKQGILEPMYQLTIPAHLGHAHQLASHSVNHYTFNLLGNYSTQSFLSQAMADIQQLCPDITLNAFKLTTNDPPQYTHYTPENDWSKVEGAPPNLSTLHYIVIGRNLSQWNECCLPLTPETRINQAWVDPQTKQSLQLFHPLDSKKVVRGLDVPLQQSTINKNVFVPRQRLVLMTISNEQVSLFHCTN